MLVHRAVCGAGYTGKATGAIFGLSVRELSANGRDGTRVFLGAG